MSPSSSSSQFPRTLPILPLPHPLILLPGSRLTFPISRNIADLVLGLLDPTAPSSPLVAAIPTLHTSNNSGLFGWGCAARILRIVKPPLRNRTIHQPYIVTLHGLTRVRLLPAAASASAGAASAGAASPGSNPSNPGTEDESSSSTREVEYYDDENHAHAPDVVDGDTIEAFKKAALVLLDKMGIAPRRDAYAKISTLVEELPAERVGWMTDVLVANVRAEFDDKLAILSTPAIQPRLELATALFGRLSSNAAAGPLVVRLALTEEDAAAKQQREAFLRQQLNAIQKELATLEVLRNSSTNGNNPNGSGSNNALLRGSPSQSPKPLSDLDDDEASEADDLAELKRAIERLRKGSEERKMAVRDWKKMKRIPPGSAEGGVVRGYLEWLTSIPWPGSELPSSSTSGANGAGGAGGDQGQLLVMDRSFLKRARAQLDHDHFGLEKVKKRLIEYLAVVRLRELGLSTTGTGTTNTTTVASEMEGVKQQVLEGKRKKVKGPILLFVGPPGTGKTSLGQSIAKALGRPFQRISLGGVRDEAEIRGHRRTYVASGPGLIVQALRKAGRGDPVILLDEIDKIGQSNFHGDPGAALLEVLDPEQNHAFNDHYINVPIDLSEVLFICTANTLETISAPLLDRCEVVQLSGYTYDEKMHIARRFLLPKQLSMNGLEGDHVEITDDAMRVITTMYTMEAGVRSLDRAIAAVVRAKAVEWAEWVDEEGASTSSSSSSSSVDAGASCSSGSDQQEEREESKTGEMYNRIVDVGDVEPILGIPRWDGEEREREEKRGLVYGLVVSGYGEGGILPVETMCVPGTGGVKLTGSLGDVIKESAELALSWLKTHSYDLCITNSRSQDPLQVPHPVDVHLHLPAGATKKDGPSAGIAMVCAFVSLMTGACVPSSVAMTGEITLRGRVTPVGGIKEKVLGAHRAGIRKVILPYANKKDVEQDVSKEVRSEMEFAFVKSVREALGEAFGVHKLAWRSERVILESRL